MFKKLKDKLAEEVKSSPQRIQQFAQAAQAAVTSASSSISDITNNDLFSIGDNDMHQQKPKQPSTSTPQQNTFQDVSLTQPSDSFDYMTHDLSDTPRQRRLSNSSFTSDVSFRLPSYENTSMYHLQSDMEVSASEAEERGFSGGAASLDRVTKEQLYSAYRRTQERYTKYRTQYADLARHYKLLERDNAKARSVLVETQDKALRRISELKEQCTLEQSAKAHLEKALRLEIEEKNLKIDSLNTKIQLLRTLDEPDVGDVKKNDNADEVGQLINLSTDNDKPPPKDETTEIQNLTTKIQKMDQLLIKYKESLKTTKEKNTQIAAELQILSTELDNKNKETEQLKSFTQELSQANEEIQKLKENNEELQNKINSYDFNKTKEMSTMEADLQKYEEEIAELRGKIDVYSKREEEYAISLAENKLSIHKELEEKEAEIKSLKNSLANAQKELQSLNIIVRDYKNNITQLQEEQSKLTNDINELHATKTKMAEHESEILSIKQKCHTAEQLKSKVDEEYQCLQLQMKQETAEKLAIIDRNVYLENRVSQLTEENTKKSAQVSKLESDLNSLRKENDNKETSQVSNDTARNEIVQELEVWKAKYSTLELEIQEERDELVKLQAEIEKLLANHESIQTENIELHTLLTNLKADNTDLQHEIMINNKKINAYEIAAKKLKNLKQYLNHTSIEIKSLQKINDDSINILKDNIGAVLNKCISENEYNAEKAKCDEILKNKISVENKLKDSKARLEEMSKALKMTQKENNILQSELKEKQTECITIIEKLQNMEKEYAVTNEELITVKEDNHNIVTKLKEMEIYYKQKILDSKTEYDNLKKQYLELNNEHKTNLEELKTINSDKTQIVAKLEEIEKQYQILLNSQTEYNEFKEKIKNVSKDYDITREELNQAQKENQKLLLMFNDSEKQCENIRASLEVMIGEKPKIIKRIEESESENRKLCIQLKDLDDEKNLLNSEIEKLKKENEVVVAELNKLLEQQSNLTTNVQELENNKVVIAQLKNENNSLKNQSGDIAMNVRKLESELEELRKSHEVIESEKERLNSLLQKIECSEQSNFTKDVAYQSHNQNFEAKELNASNSEKHDSDYNKEQLQCKIISLQTENEDYKKEMETLKEINIQLSKQLLEEKLNDHKNEGLDTSEMSPVIKYEYESLKEENKRLYSDVEGLQKYLANISKENSLLNEKLRELIISSDTSSDKNENELLSRNIEGLKINIQSGQEKIDDLLRENSLLIEENLELKDQLSNQNFEKGPETKYNHKESELVILKDKYATLLDTKNKLEQRLSYLDNMNNSVNSNMLDLQSNNEKLRLSNEKLERRLDEALVSLRHLHALQENTELEYLRNILYEYLTGSGTHSVTLAKVISAVVKFDDTQTQAVLQKEKERQGLLHQFGII